MSMTMTFPSPHSGILFLYEKYVRHVENTGEVSVPSFGDSFFIGATVLFNGYEYEMVSVPSFGDSFFIRLEKGSSSIDVSAVSVPSFGDSFFMTADMKCTS